jgi:uncharacterized RDD family membrane protein YckC
MRSIRVHLTLALVLWVCLLTGPAVSAQTAAQTKPAAPAAQGTPRPAPPAAAPLERETQPDPDPDVDDEPRRFFRPIIRLAQDYTLRAGDTVWEVQSAFGDVVIEGHVEQDVVVGMGSIRLGATAVVDGSVVVLGGSATIDENAVVRDDLVVVGGTLRAAPSFSPGGQHIVIGSPWMGETLQGLVPWITSGLLWGRLIVPGIDWVWAFVGVFFLIYLALNTVFDRPVGGSADVLVKRPLSAFMTGLLVLLLTGPALAIIAASVIGLVVVPFIICAVVVAGLVGKAGVARAIGRSVMRSESPDGRFQATATFIIGFVLLTLAYMVPILGVLTWALTTVLGLGAATITFRSLLRRERPAAPPPQVPVPPLAPSPGAPAPSATMASAMHEPAVAHSPAAATLGMSSGQFASAPAASASSSAMPSDAASESTFPVDAPPISTVYNEGLAKYPRASFLDRLAAFALDCVLVAIANAILDITRNDGFYFFLLLTYHIAFWAWRGTTLGGIICNLRVIRTHGAELRPPDAVVRGLASMFSIAALGIGCLWMLQDSERQMWHDKIAGTLVVKVPRELVLP